MLCIHYVSFREALYVLNAATWIQSTTQTSNMWVDSSKTYKRKGIGKTKQKLSMYADWLWLHQDINWWIPYYRSYVHVCYLQRPPRMVGAFPGGRRMQSGALLRKVPQLKSPPERRTNWATQMLATEEGDA